MNDELSIDQILGSIRQVILGKKKPTNPPVEKHNDEVYELTEAVEFEDNSQASANHSLDDQKESDTHEQGQSCQTSQNTANKTLEDLVMQLIEPYINKWLEDKLPELVKSLLEQKIKKIAESDEKNTKNS